MYNNLYFNNIYFRILKSKHFTYFVFKNNIICLKDIDNRVEKYVMYFV